MLLCVYQSRSGFSGRSHTVKNTLELFSAILPMMRAAAATMNTGVLKNILPVIYPKAYHHDFFLFILMPET
jgi:hypothetical protein